jgi:transcriptional regulator with XRE-family HTH domain
MNTILTEAIRLYCKEHKIRIRTLAAATGMSRSMASRFLNGQPIASDHFTKLLIWAMQEQS